MSERKRKRAEEEKAQDADESHLKEQQPTTVADQPTVRKTNELHIAVKNYARHSWREIANILDKDPFAVEQCDETGHLPLHFACSRGAPYRVVKLLVEAYPQALSVQNDYKALPLHYACDRGASPAVIRYIVEHYHKGLLCKGFFGNLPIHLLVASDKSTYETLEFLVNQCPESLAIVNDDNWMPLHHCWRTKGRQFILGHIVWGRRLEYLARKCPAALFHEYRSIADRDLPLFCNELHYRATVGGDRHFFELQFLLELYYPGDDPCRYAEEIAAHVRPLRYTVELNDTPCFPQLNFFGLLLELIPLQAQVATEAILRRQLNVSRKYLYMPLIHYSIYQAAPARLIEQLMEKRPDDLTFELGGRYLLHVALMSACQVSGTKHDEDNMKQVVDLILSRCEDATTTKSQRGTLALHEALCWKTTPLPIVRAIFEHNKNAVYQPHPSGGLTPLQLAAMQYTAAPVEAMYMMLRHDPSLLHFNFDPNKGG